MKRLYLVLIAAVLALCSCMANQVDFAQARLDSTGEVHASITNRGAYVWADGNGDVAVLAGGLPTPYMTTWSEGKQVLVIFNDKYHESFALNAPLPIEYELLIRAWMGEAFVIDKGLTFTSLQPAPIGN